ncbi:MAG: 2-oxoglutarate and iron-dependent oxygenase domain-containing protein, partial [Pseudomonadota bacterium]
MTQAELARLDDTLRAQRSSFDAIPQVDVAPLLDGSDPGSVAKEINWALANAGFMYVKNHGVPAEIVSRAFDQTRAFFDLPLDDKMALHIGNSGVAMRGYIELFGENTDPGKTLDLKECFDLGPERPGATTPFFGANQWPDDTALPGFRDAIYGYHEAMRDLSMKLLRGIAL